MLQSILMGITDYVHARQTGIRMESQYTQKSMLVVMMEIRVRRYPLSDCNVIKLRETSKTIDTISFVNEIPL